MSKALSLFHDFWNDFSSPIASGRGVFSRGLHGHFSGTNHDFDAILSGKCDFEERDDRYEIELEVPGVKKN
jgi:HSP20 family molecular chaperone IbpA